MAAPPTDVGAVQETSDSPSVFEVAMTFVGAPGTVAGVAEDDEIEGAPEPLAFFATTMNVYEIPFVRPVTVHEVEAVVHENDPEVEVTV